MSKHSLPNNLAELEVLVKRYLSARVDLAKILVLERASRFTIYLFTTFFIMIIVLFVLLLLSLAFSFWYRDNYGSLAGGFLISSGVFSLISFVVYLMRRKIFSNHILKTYGAIFFDDDKSS